jgi:hypothetical protein
MHDSMKVCIAWLRPRFGFGSHWRFAAKRKIPYPARASRLHHTPRRYTIFIFDTSFISGAASRVNATSGHWS